MYNELIYKYDIGMKLYKQRKYAEAEKVFKEILKENRKNKYVLFQMGKIRLQYRDQKGAQTYFIECIEYFPNNKYPRLELGKLYSKQGKEKEAETQFEKCIEIDQDRNLHARLELGRLYAMQGKEKQAQEMYEYIISNLDDYIYDEKSRISHILKHCKDDKSKKIHGVFNISPLEVLEQLNFEKVQKQIGYMNDIYCFYIENCGYEGGYEGDGHILNYLAVITLPNERKKLITMFPSDEIRFKEKEKIENDGR